MLHVMGVNRKKVWILQHICINYVYVVNIQQESDARERKFHMHIHDKYPKAVENDKIICLSKMVGW